MKYTIEFTTQHSGRLGNLIKNENLSYKTPIVLNYTKCGSIPYLAREVLDQITDEPLFLQVPIENTEILSECIELHGKGVATYSGLDGMPSLMTLKDTAVSNSSYFKKDSLSIVTKNGKVEITPQKYMKYVENFKVDIFHALSDGDTPESCPKKRIINAVNRTITFFNECLQLYRNKPSLSSSLFIAPIAGGYSMAYRNHCMEQINKEENKQFIAGYLLDGFHTNGESASKLNMESVCEIAKGCIAKLPSDKLRIMLGAFEPLLILKLVQIGVDIFDNTYAYLSVKRNAALTFNFDLTNQQTNVRYEIDLTNTSFKDDFTSLLKDCKCLACTQHTRAYIHHLLNTRELLGPILLMIHNMHHFMEFFKSIRLSITEDTLSILIQLIEDQKKQFDVEMEELEKSKPIINEDVNENDTNAILKKIKIADE